MEEKSPNSVKIFIFLGILSLIIITAVFAYTKLNGTSINFSFLKLLPSKKAESVNYGYNFVIPDTNKVEEAPTESVKEPEVPQPQAEPVKEEILSEEQVTFALNTNAEESKIGNVVIPKIDVNSPVFSGANGTKLMDQGFWYYPSSYVPDKGEVILICHRRFFAQNDPRSCWDLNLLKSGDLIQINNTSGQPVRYLVSDVSVKDTQDVDIFSVSEDKILKIVSCSLPNGLPGGSVNRIVVTATQL